MSEGNVPVTYKSLLILNHPYGEGRSDTYYSDRSHKEVPQVRYLPLSRPLVLVLV
jgi:hypothetical protein